MAKILEKTINWIQFFQGQSLFAVAGQAIFSVFFLGYMLLKLC